MNKTIKLSFILPCYRVEKFILYCLDSIYKIDLPREDFEVICVNDCSPDATQNIIEDFQKTHTNLILINHLENKRQGGARNTGLKIAKGQYCWFIDPDDYISMLNITQILNLCNDEMLDIFQFNYEKVSLDCKLLYKKENVPDSIVFSGVDYINNILGDCFLKNYDLSVCTRLHRTDFLKSNSIFFIENTIFEDLEFSLRCLIFSKRIKSVSESFYSYRDNPESTMNTLSNVIKGNYIFQICIIIGLSLIKLSNDIVQIDNKIHREILNSGAWRLNQFRRTIFKMKYYDRKLFLDLVRSNSSIIEPYYEHFDYINRLIISRNFIAKCCVFCGFVIFRLKQIVKRK